MFLNQAFKGRIPKDKNQTGPIFVYLLERKFFILLKFSSFISNLELEILLLKYQFK